MNAFVVDTNVPVVANGRAAQASPECVLACVEALRGIVRRERIVLDEGMLILREYMANLSMSGQPGVGDAFMKWVWNVQAVTARCESVRITPAARDGETFEEFPDDPELIGFDPSDHKFGAVALASRSHPEILNAVDSDWWTFRVALGRHGIRLRFLCPEQFAERR